MSQTENIDEPKREGKPRTAGKPARPTPIQAHDRPVRVITQSGIAGSALTAVIAIMCYLGSLGLGTVMLINKSVNRWTSDISGQVTVQIKPEPGRNITQDIDKAMSILRATKGVVNIRIISQTDSARLLEPWLGAGAFLKDLPVPRLIAVGIDPKNPPDLSSLGRNLQTNIAGASLDTHRRWRLQIIRSANTLKLVGYAILILISLTTAAIVVFATRAAMANNRDTVEVLHLIGARDKYIARLIQTNFLKLGLRAGIIAGICGALSFYALTMFRDTPVNGELGAQKISLMIGPVPLDPFDYLAFFLVPIAATLIAIVTARIAILRILSRVL